VCTRKRQDIWNRTVKKYTWHRQSHHHRWSALYCRYAASVAGQANPLQHSSAPRQPPAAAACLSSSVMTCSGAEPSCRVLPAACRSPGEQLLLPGPSMSAVDLGLTGLSPATLLPASMALPGTQELLSCTVSSAGEGAGAVLRATEAAGAPAALPAATGAAAAGDLGGAARATPHPLAPAAASPAAPDDPMPLPPPLLWLLLPCPGLAAAGSGLAAPAPTPVPCAPSWLGPVTPAASG
jgi:hypothetical protein